MRDTKQSFMTTSKVMFLLTLRRKSLKISVEKLIREDTPPPSLVTGPPHRTAVTAGRQQAPHIPPARTFKRLGHQCTKLVDEGKGGKPVMAPFSLRPCAPLGLAGTQRMRHEHLSRRSSWPPSVLTHARQSPLHPSHFPWSVLH